VVQQIPRHARVAHPLAVLVKGGGIKAADSILSSAQIRRQTGRGQKQHGLDESGFDFFGYHLAGPGLPGDFSPATALIGDAQTAGKDLRNTSVQELFLRERCAFSGYSWCKFLTPSIKMQFKHSPLPEHSELVGSFCLLCGKLVAASPNPETLVILERLHECPPLWKQRAQELRDAA